MAATPERRKDDAAAVALAVANRRRDAMFIAAYLAVIGLVYVVVHETITEYGQGVITLVLGAFIGYLTAMYQYETGTTRASAAKDTAITDLTKSAVVSANIAQASQVASDKAVAAATTTTPTVTPSTPLADGTVPAAVADEVKKP